MSEWKCWSCGRIYPEVPTDVNPGFENKELPRCRHCSSRIFIKLRPTGKLKVVRDPMFCPTCGYHREGPHPHDSETARPLKKLSLLVREKDV